MLTWLRKSGPAGPFNRGAVVRRRGGAPRPVTADHFILTSLASGAVIGQALLCVEARYLSIRWKGADRPDRRFVAARAWKAIEAEIKDGWQKGLVDVESRLYVAVVPEQHRRGLQLQFMAAPPIEAEPLTAAAVLDAYLMVQPFV